MTNSSSAVRTDGAADVTVRTTAGRGLGVFARRAFAPGELVLRFSGELLPVAEIADFTHVLQVSATHALGASGGPDDYVNHSCDPNTRLDNHGEESALVALRAVQPGDEITFDYSTCIVDEPPLPRCLCGAATCRGEIRPFRRLPRSVRRRLRRLEMVPDFALQSAYPAPARHRHRSATGGCDSESGPVGAPVNAR